MKNNTGPELDKQVGKQNLLTSGSFNLCIWCGREKPSHRQKRARTCSRNCAWDWGHATPNQRKRQQEKIAREKLVK